MTRKVDNKVNEPFSMMGVKDASSVQTGSAVSNREGGHTINSSEARQVLPSTPKTSEIQSKRFAKSSPVKGIRKRSHRSNGVLRVLNPGEKMVNELWDLMSEETDASQVFGRSAYINLERNVLILGSNAASQHKDILERAKRTLGLKDSDMIPLTLYLHRDEEVIGIGIHNALSSGIKFVDQVERIVSFLEPHVSQVDESFPHPSIYVGRQPRPKNERINRKSESFLYNAWKRMKAIRWDDMALFDLNYVVQFEPMFSWIREQCNGFKSSLEGLNAYLTRETGYLLIGGLGFSREMLCDRTSELFERKTRKKMLSVKIEPSNSGTTLDIKLYGRNEVGPRVYMHAIGALEKSFGEYLLNTELLETYARLRIACGAIHNRKKLAMRATDSQEQSSADRSGRLVTKIKSIKIHVRPSERLAEIMLSVDTDTSLFIRKGNEEVRFTAGPYIAGPIYEILALAVAEGDEITVSTEGPDAEGLLRKAVDQLFSLEGKSSVGAMHSLGVANFDGSTRFQLGLLHLPFAQNLIGLPCHF